MIDGRNLYKPQAMLDHGFTYISVGRPASYKEQEDKLRTLELSQPTFKDPLAIT
jgi:UDPglucose 6-dehydrogenase